MKVSVIGLGKLGLPLAVVIAASRGKRVIGVDLNEDLVKRINGGTFQSVEPGLNDAVARVTWNGRLQATTDLDMAVHSTSVTVVIVGTPSTLQGDFSLEYVLPVVEAVAESLAKKRSQHLVVISSTVNPGDCAGRIRSALGPKPLLAYIPEFVALGDMLEGFRNPDVAVIGADDDVSANQAFRFAQSYARPTHYWQTLSLTEAELAKVGLNFAVSVKIATANWIAELCEHYPGTNVDNVTGVISVNTRIGSKYFKGGPPFGGPCFPRDVKAVGAYAIAHQGRNAFATFPHWVTVYNEYGFWRIFDLLPFELKDKTIGIIGMAFKKDTNVTTGSMGAFVYEQEPGIEVIFYDPLVDLPGKRKSVASVFQDADVVIIALPHLIKPRDVVPREGQTIIDCWRVLDAEAVRAAGATYIALGRGEKRV